MPSDQLIAGNPLNILKNNTEEKSYFKNDTSLLIFET